MYKRSSQFQQRNNPHAFYQCSEAEEIAERLLAKHKRKKRVVIVSLPRIRALEDAQG